MSERDRQGSAGAGAEVSAAVSLAAGRLGMSRGRALQFRRQFASSLMPMVTVDNERRHLEVNAAARLIFRLSLAEMRARRIDDLTPESRLPALEGAWRTLMDSGSVTGRHNIEFVDGSQLPIVYAAVANFLPAEHLIVFAPAAWPGDEIEEMQLRADQPAAVRLSPRQLDVLRLIAAGADVEQIGRELSISPGTVRTHVRNLLERIGAQNRAHAVALAMASGLLDDLARYPI